MHIAICIGTFKRHDLLRNLLAGVSELRFCEMPAPEISVVVVDNDRSRSAEEICRAAPLRWPIKYVAEPRRNIAIVRNRAVLEAGDADFIAFLDDDEVPAPNWLDELLWTRSQFDADVVSGPVVASFTPDVPEWIRTGGFFDRPTFANGYEMDKCSTNNVLIRREVFARVHSFDEAFKLTGAEDTHYFMRVRQAGYKIVWASEAIVHESISKTRANLTWLLLRGYRLGNTWVLCELSLDQRLRVRAVRLLKACAWIARGLALAVASLFSGKAAAVRAVRTVCYGVGELTGLAGQKYQEYKYAGMDPVENTGELSEQA